MNVLLVAEEAAGIHVLRGLVDAGHAPRLVLSSGIGSPGAATVASAAAARGLPVLPAEAVREPAFAERVRTERIDLLLNVHSLHVIAPEVLEAPILGSFNLHPGPLPEWAGLNAPSWAIYHGAATFGCTVHWMTAEVDAGPVAYAAAFPLDDRETGLTLSLKCARRGVELVGRLVETAATDPAALPKQPQRAEGRRWFPRAAPHEGRVPWDLPASRVDAFVRASDFSPFRSPWGHPLTVCRGRELAIVKTSLTHEPAPEAAGVVARDAAGAAIVATADEWLRVDRVLEGDAPVDASEALAAGSVLSVPAGG
jgi:methionyl-tRNA formyltransferase